jgi:hypothetical protein
MPLNVAAIETELRKRTRYKYSWGRKQNNAFDCLTNFIYRIDKFDALIQHIQSEFHNHKDIKAIGNYAVNRWYNFHSAMAVEQLFCAHPRVKKFETSKDKFCDFYIDNIPFDHKTTVFPKQIVWNKSQCKLFPERLAKWLYDNQSNEQRQHFANRLFIVLYNKNGAHWKMKAELTLLNNVINQYLDAFDANKLIRLSFPDKKTILTDLIWVEL